MSNAVASTNRRAARPIRRSRDVATTQEIVTSLNGAAETARCRRSSWTPWDRRWPHRFWWLGCAIAVAGEAVLVLSRQGPGDSRGGLFGDMLVLLSVLFVAAGNVAGGRLQQAGYPAKAITLWSVTLATVVLAPALPWLLSGVAWEQATAWAWGGVIYLAVGATILGYGLWYWALGKGGIARVGLLQFLQPVPECCWRGFCLGSRSVHLCRQRRRLSCSGCGSRHAPACVSVLPNHSARQAEIDLPFVGSSTGWICTAPP